MIEHGDVVVEYEISEHALAEPFRIAKEVHNEVTTLTISISYNGLVGRGECNPYSVRGQNLECVKADIEEVMPLLKAGFTRIAILDAMHAGPARNAVDCALLDLECKQQQTSVSTILEVNQLNTIYTAQTIGLISDDNESGLSKYSDFSILKLKIDDETPQARLERLRRLAPEATLIVDANGSLNFNALQKWLPVLEYNEVKILEQPVAPGDEELLKQVNRGTVLFCADESFIELRDLPKMREYYDVLNIKLDKIGGITAGLEAVRTAHKNELQVLVGCMLGTSLSAAPARWLANEADFVDIDGPTMLLSDIANPMSWEKGAVAKPSTSLWGYE